MHKLLHKGFTVSSKSNCRTMAKRWGLRLLLVAAVLAVYISYARGFIFIPDEALVETDCGKVQGLNAGRRSFEFRGIPYAAPPVGRLRWRPPVPVGPSTGECWNGTLDATKFGHQCFQESGKDGAKYMGSEDCLYLNVWTPTVNPSARLPVLFYIHGGSLQVGSGNWESSHIMPSSELARDSNLVLVSINYRLQALGFMALEWLARGSPTGTSGNYGLMDLVEGLRWVQRNIGRFGGDSTKVTIMGHSSGGTAIFALLASPLCQGLFHGAVMMSASPVLNKTTTDAYTDNQAFIRNTNCSDVQCLYALTAEEVTASVPWDEYPFWHMNDLLGLPTRGLVDGALAIVDGYVLKEAPFDAWVHGKGVDVPIIIGTTAQETDLLTQPLSAVNWTWPSGDYQRHVRSTLGTFGDVIAETALRLYSSRYQSPEHQYTTMTSDARVTCGNDYLSLIAATSLMSKVYRYVTTHTPSLPFFPISPDHPSLYAFHGIDASAFFAVPHNIKDARELAYHKLMRKQLVTFIKSGHPASSNWLPYPKSTAILSTDETRMVDAYHPVECEFWLKNGFFAYSWIN